jgi:hypothetical protein
MSFWGGGIVGFLDAGEAMSVVFIWDLYRSFEISIEVFTLGSHWGLTSSSLQSWSVAGAIAATMNKEKLMTVASAVRTGGGQR